MKASLAILRHPLQREPSRTLSVLRRRRRLRALAPRTPDPVICILNGRPVLRAEWTRRVCDGDVVVFSVLPQGGGGDSNPIAAIAMIAVMYFTMGAGSAAWAGAGGATATLGGTIVGSGMFIAGSMLVNSVLGPIYPPSTMQASALAAPSPTYSLQAQGNTARLGAAIPELFGRQLIYPDYAALPYSEYAGNEQYLYQLLCISRGTVQIESIRIEDTPITNFEEIETELVTPGSTLTLFPAEVIASSEVSGQSPEGLLACTYSQTGTVITLTRPARKSNRQPTTGRKTTRINGRTPTANPCSLYPSPTCPVK